MASKSIIIAVILIVLAILFIAPRLQLPELGIGEKEEIGGDEKEGTWEMEILVEGLDTPWALDFLPDGRMIFTERPGKISIFDVDGREVKLAGEISVSEISESGLLGIAVDPEFTDNKFVYTYYTHPVNMNRISRFILIEDQLEEEFILLDNIPSARFHDGGQIKFGIDGKLYVTTGDATQPPSAQNISSLAGKILRMNSDGSVPEDNPFGNLIYSYGHRNPQGLDWLGDQLYSAEHGPIRNDEVNLIAQGGNYGWPIMECDRISTEFINPIRCFNDFTLAPGALAVYQGDLYVAGLRGSQLRRLVLEKDKIVDEEALFRDLGRIREVRSHEGYLYISTSNRDGRGLPQTGDDKIIRLRK